MEKEKLLDRFVIPLFIFAFFVFGASYLSEPPQSKAINTDLEVDFLNVGQGDAVAIKKDKLLFLVDGGPDKSILTELPKVHPPLSKKIDYIFLTHPHADHLSGLNYLFGKYSINKIFFTGVNYSSPDYREFLSNIKTSNIPTEKTYSGKNYLAGDLNVDVLWPNKEQELKNVNDTSLVLLVTYKEKRFLLLGDLSATKQDIIAETYTLPDIDVIKIAHHGSKTGLSDKLLEETKPEYAVISVGENKYGHPSQAILDSLAGKKILRTDILGSIFCKTDGKALSCTN